MSDLSRISALTMLEQRGQLSPTQRVALIELRNRYQKKNERLAGYIEPALTIGTSGLNAQGYQ